MRHGAMNCIGCGERIPVREGDNGTIHAPCAWCGLPTYAKRGTRAARMLASKTEWEAGEGGEPAPVPAKPAAPPAAAAPKKEAAPARARSSVFDL